MWWIEGTDRRMGQLEPHRSVMGVALQTSHVTVDTVLYDGRICAPVVNSIFCRKMESLGLFQPGRAMFSCPALA